ncbi:MAG: 50S ribosomal protein L29 [Alphaproteobacteria bacterium]|jgi:large subunit ribosomal protein L29|nr:50S ribosomal protein L29 [Alphaproteobacteria bacterium]
MAEKKKVKTTKTIKKDEALTKDALTSKLTDLKKEAMEQRFQHAAGQLPKTHIMRKTRREIARVKTQLNKKGN